MHSRPGPSDPEQRLRERFQTRVERFAHAGVRWELLLPASADALIDATPANVDERLPYWAELWPSAQALARHLLEQPVPVQPVLELGCGLALPSLALLARGARVLATDYYDDALQFARANAARNALAPLPTRLVDWREPDGLGRWQQVVVSDVLYERRNAASLADALERVLEPGGTARLADPGRNYLDGFTRRLRARGWRVRELERRPEGTSRVRLLELTAPPRPAGRRGAEAETQKR